MKKLNPNIYIKALNYLDIQMNGGFSCLAIDSAYGDGLAVHTKYRKKYEELFDLQAKTFKDFTQNTSSFCNYEAREARILALLFAAHLAELGEL